MTAAAPPMATERPGLGDQLVAAARRNAWTLGLIGILIVLLIFTRLIQPNYGVSGVQGLAISVLPLALATAAQAIVVISGGIDLSIGSMMALTSVVAATLMNDQPEEFGLIAVALVLGLGLLLGAINGTLVVLTRVPDIVVTLAMSFVWAGAALLVLKTPGGGASLWLKDLVAGSIGNEWIPRAAIVLLVVVAVIWIPLRRSRLGLSFYAIGSDRLAAFRSGVSVGRTQDPRLHGHGPVRRPGGPEPDGEHRHRHAGPRALHAPQRGGHRPRWRQPGRRPRRHLVGPIIAVVILQLIRTDMTFLNVNTNLATVLQGVILIGVVMVGSLIQLRRARG